MDDFQVVHPQVAGIDIGGEELFVYVWKTKQMRVFSTFTDSLIELGSWLAEQQVNSVAMEATGVLWLPIFETLESLGMEVVLVNGWHIKNVPGKKSDVADCQWIAQLHHYGLLKGGFIPDADVRYLRTLMRLRKDHVNRKAIHLQHMHKALDQMNLKLHKVISDLGGVSGLAVLRAIVAGERDAEKLAALCMPRILKHKEKELIASLKGTYNPAHTFALKQALDGWDFYQQKMEECDQEIEKLLLSLTAHKQVPTDIHPPKKSTKRNRIQVDQLHQLLVTLTEGKDPTLIPGITQNNWLELTGELGANVDPWPTEKQFVSWLGLSPMHHQSGKTKKGARYKKSTRAGQIFRQAAESVGGGKFLALTGFYKRIKAKKGPRVAIKATARKIACMYYNVMKYGLEYVEQGIETYNEQYRQRQQKYLLKKAKELGLTVVPLGTI
jgi:transposase